MKGLHPLPDPASKLQHMLRFLFIYYFFIQHSLFPCAHLCFPFPFLKAKANQLISVLPITLIRSKGLDKVVLKRGNYMHLIRKVIILYF